MQNPWNREGASAVLEKPEIPATPSPPEIVPQPQTQPEITPKQPPEIVPAVTPEIRPESPPEVKPGGPAEIPGEEAV
ncbi:hypothetical protein [Paenibacillus mucilaginosus]|uniref:Uncharacterized protein n=1 Tax=Paenibacillus mucilaginosus (strain KNP414) TaxID=1036673 RepID=F8FG82_PAEMK|nr:hypothetical protein [Paenibacillus mucilaginosus]AEI43902.1 hypothetical protein KNP414_05378 [Paenibacillus mucilaginosus KNP414]MCG7212593.1 hypothetical protein [Paenibacillus mucilaginosus]WDM25380.1 hypothetical protein KCX80_23335 [Paenibacillus mucilaginosus]